MTTTSEQGGPRRRVRPILLLPLFVFVALAAVFLLRLESNVDPGAIPSALVGKPAPAFDLPPLAGVSAGLKRADLDGKLSLVNIFASWCGPCRDEHPQLMALAGDDRIQLVGINYKDSEANARAFLAELGDPYAAIGVDARGRTGIDWGVYGVPETFLVDADGIVRYKHIGPITPEALESVIAPEIDRLTAAPKG